VRRFQKRMDTIGAASFEEYQTYLSGDGDEFSELFNTILINVSERE
jgi:two-component system CheB/CheR fusion protein